MNFLLEGIMNCDCWDETTDLLLVTNDLKDIETLIKEDDCHAQFLIFDISKKGRPNEIEEGNKEVILEWLQENLK